MKYKDENGLDLWGVNTVGLLEPQDIDTRNFNPKTVFIKKSNATVDNRFDNILAPLTIDCMSANYANIEGTE